MAGNRYAEVIDLLYEGATALFENGQVNPKYIAKLLHLKRNYIVVILRFCLCCVSYVQHTSGADLALLLVSVLEKTDAEATNDIIGW